MMDICIDNVIRYERYISVLSNDEISELCHIRPTLAQLQDWDERLTERTEDIDTIFARAYNKQRKEEANEYRQQPRHACHRSEIL